MQAPTQYQQVLPLLTPFTNAQQVIPTQLVNPLTVIANLADGAALLGGDIGDAYGGVGNGLDRPDDFIQRAVGRLGLVGRGFGMFDLGAHAFDRLPCGGLQAGDQGLDFGRGAGGALRQRAHFFGHHGKAATHFPGTRRFNGGVQRQQVGLIGNRADHR
ncbi:hypothetical protein D3C71_1002600 [compost metagenome]